MKQSIFTIATMLTLATGGAYAQSDEANKNADMLTINGGGTFSKPKIVPRMDKLGLAQVTVDYKLTTTERTVGKEKSSGKMAGAKLTAFLETTDGELTAGDFQEVTNKFYNYFQRKLKEAGIDTVSWSTIAGADFYKNSDRQESNEQEKGSGQVWVTCNANSGNTLHKGTVGFAFGKAMKAGSFADDIGGTAGKFHLVVDFAELAVNVDIKSGEHSGYYGITKTTNTKYSSAAKPFMTVGPGSGLSMVWTKKGTESITFAGEMESNYAYHTSIAQDASRLKANYFGFAKSMNPVVIETTKEQYKTAAGKALEKYADAFIAKIKQMRKD